MESLTDYYKTVKDLQKIVETYPVDCPEKGQYLLERLVKENLWTRRYALEVIKEYKRFMYLAAVTVDPVTPSLEVDECWHTHILYTRDYANFCKVLGKFIHHGPGTGTKDDDKFIDWYERTKDRYFMWFSELPPDNVWPSGKERFRPVHFTKVDLYEYWVIKVGSWKALKKHLVEFIKLKIKKLW